MKKTLLAGVAALLLGTGAAQADALPEYMLGQWCADHFIRTETEEIYFRPDRPRGRGLPDCTDDSITISQEGYVVQLPSPEIEDTHHCTFDKIEEQGKATFLVHMQCEGEFALMEFQIVNDLLFIKEIPEG
jgi:hypothetical protein